MIASIVVHQWLKELIAKLVRNFMVARHSPSVETLHPVRSK